MKYIYIMSPPRGGSTLLSLVLGNHPDIANLGEVSFIPKLLSLGEHCTCQEELSKCPEWGRVFSELEKETGTDMRESPYGLYLGDAIKQKKGNGFTDHAYQTPLRRIMAKVRGGFDSVLLDFSLKPGPVLFTLPSTKKSVLNTLKLYKSAAKAWNKTVIVDASKLPRKAIHLYLSQPENVRIIHLVRDVRGVTASRKSHLGLYNSAQKWSYYHNKTLKWLNKWVDPAHRKQLRYEDFVNKPQQFSESICEWLEIPFTEEMLSFNDNMEIHSAGGNPTRFNLAQGIRPVDEKWRKILTTADLTEIDKIAGKQNRSFGYA